MKDTSLNLTTCRRPHWNRCATFALVVSFDGANAYFRACGDIAPALLYTCANHLAVHDRQATIMHCD